MKQALWLEWLTAGWMLIEAGIPIGSGIVAHSLTLVAFGADSVIELMSAALLLRRLKVELQLGGEFPQEIEERAAKLSAALMLALSLYVIISASWALRKGKGQQFSLPGLILAIVAIPIMYGLAKAKLRLADPLGSAALGADAAESVACGHLSAVVIIGLLTQRFVEAWLVDSVSALILLPFLLREAKDMARARGLSAAWTCA